MAFTILRGDNNNVRMFVEKQQPGTAEAGLGGYYLAKDDRYR